MDQYKTTKSKSAPIKNFLRVFFVLVFVFAVFVPEKQALSAGFCCKCCTCLSSTVLTDMLGWVTDWAEINKHIYVTFYAHRIYFWDYEFWTLDLMPAMALMAEQLSAVGMQQVQIVGSFMDADEQMEAQRDLQTLMVRAHKDYHPSIEMCEFGSRVKSLAMSERQGELAVLAMSQRSLDRMLGNKSSVAPFGRLHDIRNRLNNFKKKYCDPYDNNGKLSSLCTGVADPDEKQREKYNKDIDFARTYAKPYTLDVNFTDDAFKDDEEDILSLSNNIYGFSTFAGVDPKKLANDPKNTATPLQQAYLDMRSYVAKQSVAENSFNALVAMKAEGTPGSKAFLEAYLKQLGVPDDELIKFLGSNPSYFAQMEILTKLAYQHPQFYTNLYDKPVNIERKGVALQAIGLMQKFDLLKSYMRTESSLSVLLELNVEDLQNEVENSIKALDVSADRKT